MNGLIGVHEVKVQWTVVGIWDNHYLTLKIPNLYLTVVLLTLIVSAVQIFRGKDKAR